MPRPIVLSDRGVRWNNNMYDALEFIQSITPSELEHIAHSDSIYDAYENGNMIEWYEEAISRFIYDYLCFARIDRHETIYIEERALLDLYYWPVLECSVFLEDGHEREFAMCNMILYLSIIHGEFCDACPFKMFRIGHIRQYKKLPVDIRNLLNKLLIDALHTEFLRFVDESKMKEERIIRSRREAPFVHKLVELDYDIYGEIMGTPVSASNLEFDDNLRTGKLADRVL